MVKKQYLVAALIVIVLGALTLLLLPQSEEGKVKKQFTLLSKYLSKEPGESPITMAHNLRMLTTFLSETCGLQIPAYSISGNCTAEEITAYAARARAQFSRLSVEFLDLKVRFPEKNTANATLTARATGTSALGESVNEVHELECVLKKTEKKWLLSDVEMVEVLKK